MLANFQLINCIVNFGNNHNDLPSPWEGIK